MHEGYKEKKKCNLMVDLSKFTFNEKILSIIITFDNNQVCCQICKKIKCIYKKIGLDYNFFNV